MTVYGMFESWRSCLPKGKPSSWVWFLDKEQGAKCSGQESIDLLCNRSTGCLATQLFAKRQTPTLWV